MTNAELLAKIKAEIERLYGEYKDKFKQHGDQYHLGLIDGLDMAERVLDTLSEEPDKSLEEAAGDFVWEVMEEDYDGPSELSKKLRPSSKISDYYNALAEFFKAGAKWGIEHAKK